MQQGLSNNEFTYHGLNQYRLVTEIHEKESVMNQYRLVIEIHGKESVMNQYRLVSATEKIISNIRRSLSVLRQVTGC